jgi:hypothetical protein
MNGATKYGDIALGIESALPLRNLHCSPARRLAIRLIAALGLKNRGGGRAGPGKEERDSALATPAGFGNRRS